MTSTGQRLRQFIGGIVLWAALLQAFVPAGLMPSLQKSAIAQIEICTSAGFGKIPAHAPDGKAPHAAVRHTCPFAPVLAQADMAFPPVLPAALPSYIAVFSEYIAYFIEHVAKPWFSRGPPAALRI
jgi:hypothetical protein